VEDLHVTHPSKLDRLVQAAQERFAREIQIAAMGLPQRAIAQAANMSQSQVSRFLSGDSLPDLDAMIRLTDAVGHRFYFSIVPGDGVRLRDSGQLTYAEVVRAEAHASWRFRFEAPVAPPPDRRAADVVFERPEEVNMLEIELALLDFQAQLRSAQLKRAALCDLLGRPVNLLIGVPDSANARRRMLPHTELIRSALPVSSRHAWSSIRAGEPVGGDALLWIRRRS
jgi:transcriptional regulator with XRE-family HTH domain